MKRTRFDDWPCSVARTVDLLGDWWTPLVLREAFYGARRFDEFHSRLGIGRNILTERLKRLVGEEILRKVPYQQRPTRYEYRLSRKGVELISVILAMMRWGDDWLAKEGPPVLVVDETTGQPIRPLVVDEHTGQPIDPRRLAVCPGPGFPADQLAEEIAAGRFLQRQPERSSR
ncbi:MAG: helix-turn-helix domain-containing protein [Myxococcota bacterium]